jgi:hypothetical protein
VRGIKKETNGQKTQWEGGPKSVYCAADWRGHSALLSFSIGIPLILLSLSSLFCDHTMEEYINVCDRLRASVLIAYLPSCVFLSCGTSVVFASFMQYSRFIVLLHSVHSMLTLIVVSLYLVQVYLETSLSSGRLVCCY